VRGLFVAAALALASSAASAQFVNMLKGGPAEFFDDSDIHMFLDVARKTLDEGADEQTLAWKNPKTGHGGELTVVKHFESKGHPCKEVRVRNEAQGRTSDMRHNVCNVDGKWRLLGESQL
jgi:surface antigen